MKPLTQKTLYTCFTVVLGSTLILSGCGKSDSSSGSKATGAASATPSKPVPVTFSMNVNTVPDVENNEGIKWLNQKFNMDLKFTPIPNSNFQEKFNAMVASGEMPDVFTFNFDATAVKLIKQGAVAPLDDIIAKYPNLKYTKSHYDNMSYNGKVYGIPIARSLLSAPNAPLIRQDWLDKLKLPVPKTLDELYATMQAMTNNDPDGNGKKDTYGLQLGEITGRVGDFNGREFWGAADLLYSFGLDGSGWVLKDGQLVMNETLPEYKTYLDWLKKAIAEGLVDPDFALNKANQSQDKFFKNGKSGIAFDFVSNIRNFTSTVPKTTPGAKLTAFEPPVGPTGKSGVVSGPGNVGAIFISANAAKDANKVKTIMQWLDYGPSKDNGYVVGSAQKYNMLQNYGLEGVTFKKNADGNVEVTDKDKLAKLGGGYILPTQALPNPENTNYTKDTDDPDTLKLEIAANDILIKHLKASPIAGLQSATEQNTPDMYMDLVKAKVKYVMGQLSSAEWDQALKTFMDKNGTKVTQEYNEALKNVKK
ncbi:extracellular solute-binding protein [Paenibacillus whitsoniae]|uniref:Extracellular solute-binding protein n=1 Tax=Paenibacillus whitsoniae TaxID=2496558 RepID=A0A430JJH5_9BACL|nr:extracellular solute-binding protein [Paenibacillus whitsoniae]RTE11257.1 extracellular solute-binding protein [Paenibacillus whitsoniae]